MTNSNENIKTGIIVTDITDHFPTVFYEYKKNEYVPTKIQHC